MLESKARWRLGAGDEAVAGQLCDALGIDPLLARLLVLRGISSVPEAEQFLSGGSGHFHDPFLMEGMETAVSRIRSALSSGEKIRVYGDYDADGVSSTALMAHLLRGLGANFDTYIPHRVKEGYGLNKGAVDLAKEQGVSLIITVDTGVSAVEEVAYIQELGMDVIVTDHHEPPGTLPQPLALINPKKETCPYPFKGLAGVGVALKLAQGLLGRLPEELLEIAAIGTVADLMPLHDENRLIVKLGLERMRKSAYPGLRALMDVSGVDRSGVNATHIGFSLAPRINASGRLEHASTALKLLVTEDEAEAVSIAEELDLLNKERQFIVDELTGLAKAAVQEEQDGALKRGETPKNFLVVSGEKWNVGVVGIVASRLVDTYYRPTIVLSIDPDTGMAKGSARSIAGFDMYQALTHCADLLDHYGGHQAAAGMSLRRENIAEFERRLNVLAGEWLSAEDFIPLLAVDAECSLSEVPLECIEELEKLAPFGVGNPAPKILFSGLRLDEIKLMGRERQHLKLVLTDAAAEIAAGVEAVGFGKGWLGSLMTPQAPVDIVGELSVNEWNGVRKPQLMLQDLRIPALQVFDWRGKPAARVGEDLAALGERLAALPGRGSARPPALVLFGEEDRAPGAGGRPAGPVWRCLPDGSLAADNEAARELQFPEMTDIVLCTAPRSLAQLERALAQADGIRRCYAVFADPVPQDGGAMPTRDQFKAVYASVRQQGMWDLRNPALLQSFSRRSGLSAAMISFVLDVFEELGFIEKAGGVVRPVAAPSKRDLTTSRKYQERLSRAEVDRVCVYTSAKELSDWIAGCRSSQQLSSAQPT
ncbi:MULTISPECIES: single-stranded-DNA-specific exonuclease RecJ [unclassified Paenibacillus]|uniref:single-stranded-DNA-specific exonuclease RecJ n=1 Tax=unclassified Paenibacillus TaxID=185978 RepID=UPI00020D660F|nr:MULTISPECIES: single-stranded-DNA-specific exonuclease RecJ [unclassified Paenibacillus]EGL19650.1 single-stranded-DNA-specific exonuclease RecJ [Paenibacillus sp. HGF7]EPD90450.1 single-stranded-DNA-specific exonuclease RecJ [Paenibacillus sp. HGH0039]